MEKKIYEQPKAKIIILNVTCMLGDMSGDPINEPASMDLEFACEEEDKELFSN